MRIINVNKFQTIDQNHRKCGVALVWKLKDRFANVSFSHFSNKTVNSKTIKFFNLLNGNK